VLAAPLLHFLVAGAVLFAIDARWRDIRHATGADADPVVITAERIVALREAFVARTRTAPTPAEEGALVGREIDDELLYREALARGLDRGDDVIARRLEQKARFLLGEDDLDPATLRREGAALGLDVDDVVVRRLLIAKMRLLGGATPPPAEPEGRAWYARHAARWRQPARVTLTHVFLSATRGARLGADAGALLARLRAGVAPGDAPALGDAFASGHRLRRATPAMLATLLGPAFPDLVQTFPADTWSGPVRSPYGLHLVWVEAIEPGALPPFEAVRGQVAAALRAERHDRRLARLLRQLRGRHELRVGGG
jgi:hypothetical protein